MTDSSFSEVLGTSVAFNFRSATRARTITQQITDTASIQVVPDALPRIFEDLPRITLATKKGSIKYVNADLLIIVREKRSWIWEHKYNLVEIRSKDTYWKCKICDDQNKVNRLYKASSINAAEGHLINDHKIRSLRRKKYSTYIFVNNEDGAFSSGI